MQQYDGFTPARRVFGGTPELPVGAVGYPHSRDFTNPNDYPSTQTRCVSEIERNSKSLFRMRSPRKIQFIIKIRFSRTGGRTILVMGEFLVLSQSGENKIDPKWNGVGC